MKSYSCLQEFPVFVSCIQSYKCFLRLTLLAMLRAFKKGLSQGLHPVRSMWRYCWRLIGATNTAPLFPTSLARKLFLWLHPVLCHHWHCHKLRSVSNKLLSIQNKLYRRKESEELNQRLSIRERTSFTWSYEKRIAKYECFRRTVWSSLIHDLHFQSSSC